MCFAIFVTSDNTASLYQGSLLLIVEGAVAPPSIRGPRSERWQSSGCWPVESIIGVAMRTCSAARFSLMRVKMTIRTGNVIDLDSLQMRIAVGQINELTDE